jgi:hypothetical protein
MNLDRFNLLDDYEQAKTVQERGVLVAERSYRGFKIILYQVDHFYVEVYHNNYYGAIQGMRSFESTDQLDPYLQSISLPVF